MKINNPRVNKDTTILALAASISGHKAAVKKHNIKAAEEESVIIAQAVKEAAASDDGRARVVAGSEGAPTVRNRVTDQSAAAAKAVKVFTLQVADDGGCHELSTDSFKALGELLELPTKFDEKGNPFSVSIG